MNSILIKDLINKLQQVYDEHGDVEMEFAVKTSNLFEFKEFVGLVTSPTDQEAASWGVESCFIMLK